MPDRRVAIFVVRGGDEALRLAGSCALAAGASGDRVDVYLFGPAVPELVRAADADDDDSTATLRQVRTQGRCRLIACSGSVVAEQVDLQDAERAFDAVVGWPTILEWTRGVVDRFSF